MMSAGSAMLSIRPVETRAELSTFIKVPRLLYRGLPGYDPPLDFERRELLSPRKSKFFEHGEARYWLAWRGGRPVGRISAQIDRLALSTWKADIGCFGCLDAADDAAAVAALADVAAAWLKARGMAAMRGPFALSINGESGLQVAGQERGGMVLMPWHPPYLAAHLAAAGFRRAKDLHAYTISVKSHRGAERIIAAMRGRLSPALTLRPLDLRNLGREAEIVRTVFNRAWERNWSFVPMTEAEAGVLAHAFRPFLTADMGVIAEQAGAPVAIAVMFPNLFELTAGFDGKLLPFNWLRFLLRKSRRRCRSARMILFGLVPDLAAATKGALAIAIIDELLRRQGRLQLEELELSWVLDDNRGLIRLLEAVGVGPPTKRYAMFERPL